MNIDSVTSTSAAYNSITNSSNSLSQATELTKEEQLYDLDGDGVLSTTEKAAMQEAQALQRQQEAQAAQMEQMNQAAQSQQAQSTAQLQGPPPPTPPDVENMSYMQAHIDTWA